MKGPLAVWLGFGACVVMAVSAMAWITAAALRLDRAETKAREEAALEENVRLALWRMDSALAPLIAQESAQPPIAYRTFLPGRGPDGSWLPSPFLAVQTPFVLVHFEVSASGRLTSPEVPERGERALAVPAYLTEECIARKAEWLKQLRATLSPADMLARLPEAKAMPAAAGTRQLAMIRTATGTGQERRGRRDDSSGRGRVEYQQRGAAVTNANVAARTQQQALFPNTAGTLATSGELGMPLTPIWSGDHLLLARRVSGNGDVCMQACLVDWPEMKAWLETMIADLLPEAELQPLQNPGAAPETRLLAALPVRLVPGGGEFAPAASPSPVWLSLGAAWIGAALAVLAVTVLLRGVLRLSERRATFVSAVTHELRTPLTTFQMYTEMLTGGMVPEPDRRQEYLETLGREAARLTHLVENVLAYARLERGRSDRRVESTTLADLLDPTMPRLSDHAVQSGVQLTVDIPFECRQTRLAANRSSVEQILFNLIDNACKYGHSGPDNRIVLTADRAPQWLQLRVRDHGPGLGPGHASRLFRPFSKSAADAAQSAPGVGLGLTLSRRLARAMQGDLFLDRSVTDGACFVLALRYDDGHNPERESC